MTNREDWVEKHKDKAVFVPYINAYNLLGIFRINVYGGWDIYLINDNGSPQTRGIM